MKNDALSKRSDALSGVMLLLCAVISLVMANVGLGETYLNFWNKSVFGHPLSHWIDDGLMAVFFLLVGLEIKKEIYVGELRSFKLALLPLAAAIGGMLIPATIYLAVNYGLPTTTGFGIPMSTDIVFVVGILALLGHRVPSSLKVFLLTLAVVDDIGAVVVIALFYSAGIDWLYLCAALLVFVMMIWFNKARNVDTISIYMLLGVALWVLLMASGVHATMAGILTAAALPFRKGKITNPTLRLARILHRPVYLIVLPLFVLSNTAVVLRGEMLLNLMEPHALGIMLGLLLGKPIGIVLLSWGVLALGWAEMPANMRWRHLIGAGCLGGIGFTMSIFVATLSFSSDLMVDSAKIAILLSSAFAAVVGCVILLPHVDSRSPHLH